MFLEPYYNSNMCKYITLLNNKGNQVFLKLRSRNSSSCFVFIGGAGDTKDTFDGLINKLSACFAKDLLTVSFSAVEEGAVYTLEQQTEDLIITLDYLIETHPYNDLVIVCTSDGAFSTTAVLKDRRFANNVSNVMYLDPADYYLSEGNKSPWNFIWNGYTDYQPTAPMVSDFLKTLSSNTKVHVVNFTIRNHGPEGYCGISERNLDHVDMFPRLNNEMVKAFFEKAPDKNRGVYIEDSNLPHAFERDGAVSSNEERLAEITLSILG